MTTPNLGLPELAASQANPHLTVNAALRRIDVLLKFGVLSFQTLTVPPVSPAEGDLHVVAAAGATGAWLGFDGQIAYRASNTWQFVAPREGMLVYFDPALYVYTSGAWFQLFNIPCESP